MIFTTITDRIRLDFFFLLLSIFNCLSPIHVYNNKNMMYKESKLFHIVQLKINDKSFSINNTNSLLLPGGLV